MATGIMSSRTGRRISSSGRITPSRSFGRCAKAVVAGLVAGIWVLANLSATGASQVPVIEIASAIPIYVSESEPGPLLRAVEDLQRDLRNVLGLDFSITHDKQQLDQELAI